MAGPLPAQPIVFVNFDDGLNVKNNNPNNLISFNDHL